MTKHPASLALGQQRVCLILPWLSSAVAKQERRVSHDVLKTQTIRIKKSDRDRPMSGIGVPSCQPVRFPKEDEVFKTCVTSELSAESHGRGEWSTQHLVHGGYRVQDNAGVTARWDNGIVQSEDSHKGGTEVKDLVQGGIPIERQHEVARRLASPTAANKLGLFGTSVLYMLLDGANVRCSVAMAARGGRQVPSMGVIDKSELCLRDGFWCRGGNGGRAGGLVEESGNCPVFQDVEP